MRAPSHRARFGRSTSQIVHKPCETNARSKRDEIKGCAAGRSLGFRWQSCALAHTPNSSIESILWLCRVQSLVRLSVYWEMGKHYGSSLRQHGLCEPILLSQDTSLLLWKLCIHCRQCELEQRGKFTLFQINEDGWELLCLHINVINKPSGQSPAMAQSCLQNF